MMKYAELIAEYTRCFQNQLSSKAERRMMELHKIVEEMGLKFVMTNEASYMMPNYLGKPKFELAKG